MINDSLGHAAGDELLLEIARRLEGSLRAADTVARFEGEHTLARMGGDEFTVLLGGISDHERALAVAERLRAADFAAGGRAGTGSRHLGQHRDRRQRRALSDGGGNGPRRRYRDVSREGAGQVALRSLRRVDARGGRRAAGARIGSSPGAREEGADGLLPADRLAARRAALGLRGAAALASSAPRARAARRIHSDRGGNRPDRPDRQMGAPRGLPSARLVAEGISGRRESRDQRQPVGAAVHASRSAAGRAPDSRRHRRAPVTGEARDHRRPRARELRRRSRRSCANCARSACSWGSTTSAWATPR